MIQLRGYQRDFINNINTAWALGVRNVMGVLPTGAGKTACMAEVLRNHRGAACVIAHRQELVTQISMALSRAGVRHRVIAPQAVIRMICAEQFQRLGESFYDPSADVGVAGVDTLIRRVERYAAWLGRVTLYCQDEAHHVLRKNKWGKACELFPTARGLLVTATPDRADRKGLGAHADGVAEVLIVGPSMRDLISWGYLTDYRLVVAETHIEGLEDAISKTTGDYVLDRGKGKAAVRGSTLIGDVVREYRTRALGTKAVCFASDLETAGDIAQRFRDAGTPAEVVDGNTPSDMRAAYLRRFESGEIHVLVNVDLFGEGFDLPAIETVIMARKTKSFALFAQQLGRGLRLMIDPALMARWDEFTAEERLAHIAASPKPRALIIDHVGNVLDPQLGLPDSRTEWTLDAGERAGRGGPSDAVPLTVCTNLECSSPMPRFKTHCPVCGHRRVIAPRDRSAPEFVDGDMLELDPAALAALRSGLASALQPLSELRAALAAKGTPHIWASRHLNLHKAKLDAADRLGSLMAWWAGERRAEGLSDPEIMRLFFLTFGIDWISARAQDTAALASLSEHIERRLSPATLKELSK